MARWFDGMAKSMAKDPSAFPGVTPAAGISGVRRSRRQFTKVATATVTGIGAAGYVKPAFRSFGIPVAMGASPVNGDPGNQPCPTFQCGFGACASRPNASPSDCFCFEVADTPGQGICLGNYFCASAVPCTSTTQCPTGFICTVNTCCGPQGLCAPPCPPVGLGFTSSQSLQSAGGMTAGYRG